jgi:hypothetical protein
MHTVFATDEKLLTKEEFVRTLLQHKEQFVQWLRWHRDMVQRRFVNDIGDNN